MGTPRQQKRLNALQVSRITAPGRYADGLGLYLQVGIGGAKSWILRYRSGGKTREMGLGSAHTVLLAQARAAALEAQRLRAQGIDPLAARSAAEEARRAEAANTITFKEAAETYITERELSWKSQVHRRQWRSTLRMYAFPTIGDLAVNQIDLQAILKILEPIWRAKPETADRVRSRIEAILDWSNVRGFCDGDNPARWRGRLEKILPVSNRSRGVRHHPALAFDDLPEFLSRLRLETGLAAKALELLILTGTRTSETLNAEWQEFDLSLGVWTIPGNRMKAGRDHRVPLCAPALSLLRTIPATGRFVFPGIKHKPLSNMAMLSLRTRMGFDHITIHGFRSTFRDWVSECTTYSPEVAEMALAHTVANKVEAAYRRGDLFEKRRALMADWANYCEGKKLSAQVLSFAQEGKKTPTSKR